ncbi:hypothetical protein [Vallitalea okinawensis]|uniref:hypothetical protein n=1 Tax=Vallitalea okinawensis TaxID=2078660 RepID=UPI000CFBEC66|nr:hypothetical protein [Vallitalea okinawensis]
MGNRHELQTIDMRNIHADGCIQYSNGDITYYLIGDTQDLDEKARTTFLTNLYKHLKECKVDIYVLDNMGAPDIFNRYVLFDSKERLDENNDLRTIINYNLHAIEKFYDRRCVVFGVRTKIDHQETLKKIVDSSLLSIATRRQVAAIVSKALHLMDLEDMQLHGSKKKTQSVLESLLERGFRIVK